jgi:mycothiol synthase
VNFEDSGRVFARGYIHPDYQRQGLGSQLLRASDAHALEITKHIPDEKPIYMQRFDLDTNVSFAALMQSEGYFVARHFYRMMIDELPTSAPTLPEGITLRPFELERDTRAVYDAVTEAFRDHWGGSVATPYDLWRHYTVEKPDFDPKLWLIAYDGDEIAGVCLCRLVGESMPDAGYIGNLGVRRAWRRRGLGDALLRQAFVMFHELGYKRAALGVDAGSQTNAVALYERAGMYVFQRRTAYRKVLRGDAALIVE